MDKKEELISVIEKKKNWKISDQNEEDNSILSWELWKYKEEDIKICVCVYFVD